MAKKLNDRPIYQRIGGGAFLFFFVGKGITPGSWYIGPKVGSSVVWLNVNDKANKPTEITKHWEIWDGVRWMIMKKIKVIAGEQQVPS